jgi:hypothetical protein
MSHDRNRGSTHSLILESSTANVMLASKYTSGMGTLHSYSDYLDWLCEYYGATSASMRVYQGSKDPNNKMGCLITWASEADMIKALLECHGSFTADFKLITVNA